MLKKIVFGLFSIFVAFSLCSCGNNLVGSSNTQDDFLIEGESIEDYIAQHNKKIYMQSDEGGYYDNKSNRKVRLNREIQSNGDIISTSYEYLGDFVIEKREEEYVNEYYEINTNIKTTLYFRQWKLGDISKKGDFQYAPPYLFYTYNNILTVYELKDDCNIDIIYEIEMQK